MKEQTGIWGAISIYFLPTLTLLGITPYSRALTFNQLIRGYLHPGMIGFLGLTLGFFLLAIMWQYRRVRRYMEQGQAEKLSGIQRRLITFPKILLISGLLYGLIMPQVLLFFIPGGGAKRLDMLFLGYSNCIFFSMISYILFIQRFEHWTRKIPFSEKYLSMKLSVRVNLVTFFAITSMSAVLLITFKNTLDQMTDFSNAFHDIILRGFPTLVVGILGGLLNILLLMRGLTHRIALCRDYAGSLARGDVSLAKIETVSRDELGLLAFRLGMVRDNMNGLISSAKAAIADSMEVKDDLTRVADTTVSAINGLTENIKAAGSRIEGLDSRIEGTTDSIEQFSSRINTVSDRIMDQSAMIEESNAGIVEIISSVESISNVARDKIQNTTTLNESTGEGSRKIGETTDRLANINRLIGKIQEITGLIQSIAAQTNLLAMNAAIEAAHAGETGRGFAVVADEIRKLASHASENSRKIKDNVGEITKSIGAATAAGDSTTLSFEKIEGEIIQVVDSFREIDTGLGELKVGSEHILQAVTSLNESSQQLKDNADAMQGETENTRRAMQDLRQLSIATRRETEKMTAEILVVKAQADSLKEQTRRLDKASAEVAARLAQFKTS